MTENNNAAFVSELNEALADFEIEPLTAGQLGQLAKHYQMLCKWNTRINLSRITEPRNAARLSYAESLFGAQFVGGAGTLLDIGSGAGFPAIPLAILRPDIRVTALEANQKKSFFLVESKHELSLTNFMVITARLENVSLSDYQILTSRALDSGETIFPRLIDRLGGGQKLMLYCVKESVAKLLERTTAECNVETHSVPKSEKRIIAIFSRKN